LRVAPFLAELRDPAQICFRQTLEKLESRRSNHGLRV
jgi:hypothetical protein